MRWQAIGKGRPVNAPGGANLPFNFVVEAADVDEARLKVYDSWEHLRELHLIPLPGSEGS